MFLSLISHLRCDFDSLSINFKTNRMIKKCLLKTLGTLIRSSLTFKSHFSGYFFPLLSHKPSNGSKSLLLQLFVKKIMENDGISVDPERVESFKARTIHKRKST